MNAKVLEGEPSQVEVGLLRFATAGSVDDGKSTLIGRLLFDAKALFDDQVAQLDEHFDLAGITDGLRAEREQGITIDVAYRYFATPARRFIIADCPGHVEYTRNTFTGMSTADAALLLVDVRNGVVEQTRRHTFIAGLLEVSRVIFCVNKMDMVDYDQAAFEEVAESVRNLAHRLGVPHVDVVPVSALKGDNVIERSPSTPWYEGPSLLELLETVPTRDDRARTARFAVQTVLRKEDHNDGYRGYAGQVAGGKLAVGDEVVILPSGRRTTISSIDTYDGRLDEAGDGESVSLQLADQVDVSRGDLIAPVADPPSLTKDLRCTVCWMSSTPLPVGAKLEIKHGTRRTRGVVRGISSHFDFTQHDFVESEQPLGLNDIAHVDLRVAVPLPVDPYREHPTGGRMLLIDPRTKETVGTALVNDAVTGSPAAGVWS